MNSDIIFYYLYNFLFLIITTLYIENVAIIEIRNDGWNGHKGVEQSLAGSLPVDSVQLLASKNLKKSHPDISDLRLNLKYYP